MEIIKPYALATATYLTVQSIPLLLTPSLLITLCVPEPRRMTDLETYLSRTLALSLLALAAQTVVLTDILPLGANTAADTSDSEIAAPKNPYAKPTVIITTIYHALSAFYLYTRLLTPGGNFAFTAGMALSSTLFCVGIWALLFGDEKSRLSKTGNDKRTSNFPFENRESATEKKKEEREKDKEAGKGGKRKSVLRTGSSR